MNQLLPLLSLKEYIDNLHQHMTRPASVWARATDITGTDRVFIERILSRQLGRAL
jgi:hypothetical protein